MAPALPYIAVALSAGAAVQQHSAGRQAKRAAERNARAIEAERAEEARRLKNEQQKVEATAKARAAASGIGGESKDIVMGEMGRQHQKELQWLRKSGSMQAGIARAEGSAASKRATAGAIGTLGQTAGMAYGYFKG